MEKDDELKGRGNSYDFGARMFDPRVGRFFSMDSKKAEYPNLSPYIFANDNPILCIDSDGEAWFTIHQDMTRNAFEKVKLKNVDKEYIIERSGSVDFPFSSNMNNIKLNLFLNGPKALATEFYKSFSKYPEAYEYTKPNIPEQHWQGDQKSNEKYIKDLLSTGSQTDLADAGHAVQDVYFYTNYVELGMNYFGLDNIPTFENAMKNESFKEKIWNTQGKIF